MVGKCAMVEFLDLEKLVSRIDDGARVALQLRLVRLGLRAGVLVQGPDLQQGQGPLGPDLQQGQGPLGPDPDLQQGQGP